MATYTTLTMDICPCPQHVPTRKEAVPYLRLKGGGLSKRFIGRYLNQEHNKIDTGVLGA